jgi:hypothetical protein
MANPYTNGFNYTAVIAKLFGRMGWIQPTIVNAPVIDSASLISKSGRYFNDGSFHALVTPSNIRSLQEDDAIDDDGVNALLDSIEKGAIMRSLNGVFNVREYFEQVLVYEKISRSQSSPVNNTGLFAGYEINLSEKFDTAVQIDSVSLMFDSNCTFTLYLFKDGKKTAVWSKSVTAVAYEATVVDLDDCILNYISQATKGDVFYFGYFQDDLGAAKAIMEQTCEFNESFMFRARPITAKKTGTLLADFVGRSSPTLPYGLNLEMSSFRDFTQAITKKANLFDELVGLTLAVMVLELALNTIRSNKDQRIIQDQADKWGIQLDLNGVALMSDSPQITGLKSRVYRETERVRNEFYPKIKSRVVNMADDCDEVMEGYYK